MWGDDEEDTIVGNNSYDMICGGKGIFDSLDGKGGADVVVDCLGSEDALSNGPSYCDHSIYGNDGDDIVCFVDKDVGVIADGARFCLDGGDHYSGDHWWDDDQTGVIPIDCEEEASLSDCTLNGSFICSCE
jgi:hypothetical protein